MMTQCEFTDTDKYAKGVYFIGRTYDSSGKERSAWDYRPGEQIVFKVTLYSHGTDGPIACPMLKWSWQADDAAFPALTGVVCNDSTVTFSAFINHPGYVRARVEACDENGELIAGAETFQGGAIADMFSVGPAKARPHDFGSFWRKQMERLYAVDPTDTVSAGYSGSVQTRFDLPSLNRYQCRKLNCEDMARMREKKIFTQPDSFLEEYDVYTVSLKCPGPAPSTFVMTIPRMYEPGTLYTRVLYDAYTIHKPDICAEPDCIFLHVTHHGYPVDQSDGCSELFREGGILSNYALCNGRPNSDYDDKEDCYSLYMFLRDFQALRFIADSALSGDIEGLHRAWNGMFQICGGSMGGYQTLGICGLSRYLPQGAPGINIVNGTADIPAFCDLSAAANGRVFCMPNRGYVPNMDYFDAANFAPDIACTIRVPRCGLGDESCPVTGVLSMFNSMSCRKSITIFQNSGHCYVPEEAVQIKYSFVF